MDTLIRFLGILAYGSAQNRKKSLIDELNIKSSRPLNYVAGTIWVSSFNEEDSQRREAIKLLFESRTSVTIEFFDEEGCLKRAITGEYTYEHPTVLFSLDSGAYSQSLTFNGHLLFNEQGCQFVRVRQ